MKKSVWIFLLAVLLPSVVLGWLALRSAEEQQIVFERRTAELYQKETESLAVTVRDTVDAERRVFGETGRGTRRPLSAFGPLPFRSVLPPTSAHGGGGSSRAWLASGRG